MSMKVNKPLPGVPTGISPPPQELVDTAEPPPVADAPSDAAATAEEESTAFWARALWAWPADTEGDLKIEPGDLVYVIQADKDGWSYGDNSGAVGWFPSNYVEPYDSSAPESAAPATDGGGSAGDNSAVEVEPEVVLEEPKKLSEEQLQARVVAEIVETERDYVKNLVVVIEGYKRHAEAWNRDPTKHVLDNSAKINVEELFANIEDLKAFHDTFAGELHEAAKSGVAALCQAFLGQNEKFKMYATYCSNHPRALAIMEEMQKAERYKQFLLGCRLLIQQDIPLEGFLLTPIQRLCKYPLLFKELAKHTPEGSPERAQIEATMEQMKKAAGFVNEMQRLKEMKKLLLDLQSRIEDWEGPGIAENNIEILMEASLTKISKNKAQERTFFLFDHMLLYCKAQPLKKRHYIFKGAIPLDKLNISNIVDGTFAFGRGHLTNAFQIIRLDLGEPKTYYVYTEKAEDKAAWLLAIERAQSKLDFVMQLPQPRPAPKEKPPTVNRNSKQGGPPPPLALAAAAAAGSGGGSGGSGTFGKSSGNLLAALLKRDTSSSASTEGPPAVPSKAPSGAQRPPPPPVKPKHLSGTPLPLKNLPGGPGGPAVPAVRPKPPVPVKGASSGALPTSSSGGGGGNSATKTPTPSKPLAIVGTLTRSSSSVGKAGSGSSSAAMVGVPAGAASPPVPFNPGLLKEMQKRQAAAAAGASPPPLPK